MKILVLGIGNVMFSDEGIGVHITKMIEKNYTFYSKKHTIDFVDGGTLANILIPTIVEYDNVLIIDCIDADDGKIGDVYFFDYNDMPKMINWSGSAHEVEMLQTLQMMEILGDRPETKILGVVPKRIEPLSFDLSEEIQKAVPLMEKTIINHLKQFEFEIKKIANYSVQDIADQFKKEQYDN
ncbi:[Ni-Fe] hydrogenase maturation protease [Campylobacter blaseri]|uniref:HyaD/HybD family hydrogenase maturation endopeptidase n=1 Tax=Campylobacter blaseri TaxID=2042961 RepID=A0A2P8QYT8_9BACT|nr:HyaD/HybD family hydrogenase maturation endopeptidase [Campylobacter blaseri]PSM51401.1 HyaD/HybD family hydrogenase maturation endopeptidase [Campylobacter blaseri]PSM52851.1 HyaD/HybD family hydrogenase maturation endopeptidase [Campylobacter blaseri]QKF86154.1 [Ni-Fe] hydrogenase maturation protease [Campylobacter blaseri]